MENKTCKQCGTNYTFTDKDTEFYNKISPTFANQKQLIPSPTLCPDCRQQRRLTWANQRKLYKGTCASSWNPMLSLYSPDSGYKVYKHDFWRSDQWDATDYGQDFDFSQPFFQQFDKLMKNTPHPNLFIINSENSEFNNGIVDCKNCYMCFGNNNLENAYYVSDSMKTTDSSDVWWSGGIEKSYECSSSGNLYQCFYCYNSSNSSNSIFIQNCDGCHDCIMCFGLQNAKYHIKNKQYSPEEYKIKRQEFNLGNYNSLQNYKKEFQDFLLKNIHSYATIVNSENCSGDYIFDCQNCQNGFNLTEVSESKNLYEGGRVSNVQDATFVYDNEGLVLECTGVFGNSFHVLFSEYIYGSSRDIIYSSNLHRCTNCFGCIGLRNKEYCILNKQYTKEEYEKLVPQIIEYMRTTGEWGEFFPANISRFAYNETPAQEYYPLEGNGETDKAISIVEKESNLGQGFKYKWLNKDYPVNIPPTMPTIDGNDLIIDIKDMTEDYEKQVLNSAIICSITNKPFRFTKSELDFYKKQDIALPRKSPDARHIERMNLRNPRKIYDRKCAKCGIDVKSTFSPNRGETIYCKDCYLKETY